MVVEFITAVQRVADWLNSRQGKRKTVLRITGGGGAGKSVFMQAVCGLVDSRVAALNTDSYLVSSFLRRSVKDEVGERLTACHPEATFLPALERDVSMLKSGRDILLVPDSHQKPRPLQSETNVIIEGIGAIFVPAVYFDLSIFVFCDEEIEMARRISRDSVKRGVDTATVVADFKIRRGQFNRHVWPRRSECELVLMSRGDFSFECLSDSKNIIAAKV